MKSLFNNFLYEPLYNALIFIIGNVPWADVGIAVVILTVVVKLILFPLSIKAVRTQVRMKIIQKPLEKIKEKYKNDREAMGREMLALYKNNKINPFSGFLLILIQIPVILALYWVFLRAGLPDINTDILYSFVNLPETINMNFLGFINVGEPKSLILALLAAITQFFQARFSFPKVAEEDKPKTDKPSIQADVMKGMSFQIRYVLPVVIFFIAYSLIAAAALYWTVSNSFAIAQELYVRRKIRRPEEERQKREEEKESSNKDPKVIA
jgi:YidC/Oxa1 family membrane protein insertase